MAERELPPLHVKLTGDASGYDAMMNKAIAKIKELDKVVAANKAAQQANANAFRLTGTFKRTTAMVHREAQAQLKRNAGALDKLVAKSFKGQEKAQKEAQKNAQRIQKEDQNGVKRFYSFRGTQVKKAEQDAYRLTGVFKKTAADARKEQEKEYKKNADALDKLMSNAYKNQEKAQKEAQKNAQRIQKEAQKNAQKIQKEDQNGIKRFYSFRGTQVKKAEQDAYKLTTVFKKTAIDARKEQEKEYKKNADALDKLMSNAYKGQEKAQKEAQKNSQRIQKEDQNGVKRFYSFRSSQVQKAEKDAYKLTEVFKKTAIDARKEQEKEYKKNAGALDKLVANAQNALDKKQKEENKVAANARKELNKKQQQEDKRVEALRKQGTTERELYKQKQAQHLQDFKNGVITQDQYKELRRQAREKSSWHKEARRENERAATQNRQRVEDLRRQGTTEREVFKERQREHLQAFRNGEINRTQFLELRRQARQRTSWHREAARQTQEAIRGEQRHAEAIRRTAQQEQRAAAAARARARSQAFNYMTGRSGGGMGNRADIYMHSGALRSMAAGVGSFLLPGIELEATTAQMTVFTQSTEKAKEIVTQLQKLAIITPYNTQSLAENATLMMRYGMSVEKATDLLKNLGEVAAGDENKLHLLTYAMSQISNQGILRGQELRQLTEHGFNPLQIMAEQTATDKSEEGVKKRYAELDELMRKRKISAEDVAQALKVATTEGGLYAGMQDKMSKTVKGMTQQVLENIQALQTSVYDIIEEDLKSLLRTMLQYLAAFRAWVKENKETVKAWAYFAMKIFAAVAAFHALGMIIAWISWSFSGLRMIIGVIVAPIMLVYRACMMLGAGLRVLQMGFVFTWLSALAPVAAVIAAILLVAAIIGTIALSLWYPGGLVSAFYDATQAIIGFFWNMSENITKIIEWAGRNWKALIIDTILAITGVGGIVNTIVTLISGNTIGEHIGGKYDEMGLNLAAPKLSEMFKMPEAPKPEEFGTLPKYEADWSNLGKGTGKDKKVMADAAPDAIRAGSAEHAKQIWEWGQKKGGVRVAEPGDGEKSKKDKREEDMVAALKSIERNTRPSTSFEDSLSPAGLGELV